MPDKDEFSHHLDAWLEAIDQNLAKRFVFPISERPFKALVIFLEHAVVQAGFGDEEIDLTKPIEHMNEPWFSALYGNVLQWYVDKYGKEVLKPEGSTDMSAVVLYRGAPFLLLVPTTRSEVEEEGKSAWICFEDHVLEREDPFSWLPKGPEKNKIPEGEIDSFLDDLLKKSNAMRGIAFRFGLTKKTDEADRFARATLTYLQAAAKRIASGKSEEFGMAWYDCQMAMESALKLVTLHNIKQFKKTHNITELIADASPFGVAFDAGRLQCWPNHKTLSDNRYGRGNVSSIAELYDAYSLAIDLCSAAALALTPEFGSGMKFLIQRPLYLRDSASLLD